MPGVQGGPPKPEDKVKSKIYVPEGKGLNSNVSVLLQIANAGPRHCCVYAVILFAER